MTKMFKWLGGAGLAVALGVLLFGFSGAINATEVAAALCSTDGSEDSLSGASKRK